MTESQSPIERRTLVILFGRSKTRVGVVQDNVSQLNPKLAVSEAEAAVELARRAGAGDTDATAQLLRLIAPEVLRVVRSVMGAHAADVDDAVQQALIALIHALPAYRGDCAPAGYACRIAFRTALAIRKRRSIARLRHDATSEPEHQADGTGLSAASDARRRTELVRNLLDELPSEQAEALAMRTMLGWSLEEIALASGCPLNTVRSRLRLAKEAMRRKIESDPALAEELGV